MKSRFLLFSLLPALLVSACVSTGKREGPATAIEVRRNHGLSIPDAGTVSGSLERAIISGKPGDLLAVIGKTSERELSSTEFGRAAAFVAATLLRRLYPDEPFRPSNEEPPESHPMVKAMRTAKEGRFIPTSTIAKAGAVDSAIRVSSIFFSGNATDPGFLGEVERLESTELPSILPELARAVAREREGAWEEAIAFYRAAIAESGGCAYAEIGVGRCLLASDARLEAKLLYAELAARYPLNLGLKRDLAMLHYAAGEWAKADALLMAVLQRFPEDSAALLARAHALVEMAKWYDSIPLLDAYAKVDKASRLYNSLRVRVEWEGFRARDAALASCDAALRLFPGDREFLLAKADILISAPGGAGKALEMTNAVLRDNPYDARALRVEAKASAETGDWPRARGAIEALSIADPKFTDHKLAYAVYSASGDREGLERAVALWFAADPDSEDACLAWLRVLGQKDEARSVELIRTRLSGKGSPRFRSDLFYLRSRFAKGEEAELRDLRQSLMEFPQNADALTAMFDINFRRGEHKAAQAYLKQALVLRPESRELLGRKAALDEAMSARP